MTEVLDYFDDILEAVEKIERFTDGMDYAELGAVKSWAADSEYIDPEHVWPLGIGCLVVLVALPDVRALKTLP
jgi:hypothetical protein